MFYTTGLSGISVFAGTVVLLLMLLLRCLGVRHLVPYILLGVVLWTCVLKSGIHATLAGVATAFVIPGEKRERSESNLADIIHGLHPWVAFMILPSFAFVNAGIDFEDLDPARLVQPLPMGIFFGLFLGKMLGVFSVSAVAIKLKFASLPSNCNWGQLFGVSILCGIGFTMSLFIGGLAFSETGVGYARPDRLAIILASCASAILGYLVLSASSPGRNPQV
jgi:NhaA family Na+:H+ antiporter